MIRNYLKTALRVMMRQTGYSAINVIGLSTGIAATLLIIIYIVDELSFDRMHADADRMYRVHAYGRLQGNDFSVATSPAPVGEAMQKEIPEVAEVVRFGMFRTMPMSVGEKAFTEKRMLIADSNFFQFFAFEVIKGNPKEFLKGANKIVITESVARKYFGDQDPIGKLMTRGSDKITAEVTGLVKDAPANSHIQFDAVLSAESWQYMRDTQWTSNNIYTYFKIHPNASISSVQAKLDKIVETNAGSELQQYIGLSFQQFKEAGNDYGLKHAPFTDIHLYSNLSEEISPNGNVQYLYIFGVIAGFIILIACINFMNLSTARSANRAKEVGVRKTIGAHRERLIFQFLSESLLYSIVSTILALGIIAAVLDAFNLLSGKNMDFGFFFQPAVLGSIIVFAIIVGVIAGSYPAFYLTAFKPTEVLKGKVRAGFRNSALRNGLVVFQFIISIGLIFGTIVVYRQLGFMQKKHLGFDKENVVTLLHTMALGKNSQAFKNEIAANPQFKGASFANQLPPNLGWNSAFRKGGSQQDFLLFVYHVDHDHAATMGYEMAEGRFFSKEYKSDTAAIILNETAYKAMNFKNLEEAFVMSYQGQQPFPLKVIGVMKDFNYQSLRDEVKPLAILLGSEPNYEMAIRLSKGDTEAQIKKLEEIFNKYAAGSPFEYSFLDENFDSLFRAEQRMGQIILIFTILAITIACLGLFGLAAFTAEQRSKEMSIRKVMGASVGQIVYLISKDFAILIAVAFVIAIPMAWYLASNWLQNFANRTTIDFVTVIISGAASILIAFITISYQSIRAAKENPVHAMRSE